MAKVIVFFGASKKISPFWADSYLTIIRQFGGFVL
jgi:hypothetical protein